MITPSSHLLDLCRASPVTANKKCVRLPNCIDTQSFQPNLVDKAFMSNLRRLTFGYNDLILVFAANKGTQNKLKGWDILFSIVKKLSDEKNSKISVIVCGGQNTENYHSGNVKIINVGLLKEPKLMNTVYQYCDLVTITSPYEAFGLTAAEAQASGKVVIGFNGSGLEDIIISGKTGFLVERGNTLDYQNAIEKFMVLDANQRNNMETNARINDKNFSEKSIIEQFDSITSSLE